MMKMKSASVAIIFLGLVGRPSQAFVAPRAASNTGKQWDVGLTRRQGILEDLMGSLLPDNNNNNQPPPLSGATNEVVRTVNGIRHKRLGGTDIVVSEVGLGTQRWGSADFNAPGKEECFRMMDHAILEAGVNLIDTAEQYPIPSDRGRPEGSTEAIIGEWMAQGGNERRDQVVVATKVTGGGRVSRRGIIEAVEGSLRRLRTDRIDLLQTHWPARYSPQSNWGQSLAYRKDMQQKYGRFADFDEITATMGELVAAGKIRGYGFCNDNAVGLVGCAEAAKRLGVAPPCVMQNDFSLLNRRVEENGVAEASAPWHYNAGFFGYNALCGGVLTGKYLDAPPAWEAEAQRLAQRLAQRERDAATPAAFANAAAAAAKTAKTAAAAGEGGGQEAATAAVGSSSRREGRFDDPSWGRTLYRYRSGPAEEATRAYAALAQQHGMSLLELSLRWCCGREALTSVLLGSSDLGQLKEALAAFRAVANAGDTEAAAQGGATRGCALSAELAWEIDRVHLRNRLPIFSSTDTGKDWYGTGSIGEPIP